MLSRVALRRSFLSRSISTARGRSAILEKRPDDVVITFAKRTAMGRVRKGQLKDTPVDELMHALFSASLQETKLNPAEVEDICVGTCHPPSPLYVSRAAALAAGFPAEVPISTVNRLCSSGLQAIRSIAHAIESRDISLGLAVGVETNGMDLRNGYNQTYNVSRKKQDEYALISHTRAEKALEAGIFAEEIIPIELRGVVISADDTVRKGVTADSLSKLKPVFPDWGEASTTAGNASGIGDGAALCILTTRARAEKEGMPVLGKYVASTFVGVEPRYMGIAPVAAIPKVLAETGLTKEDIDVWEINEAFASQFAYCVEQLQIPIEKINPNGGAISLTHPLGMTGIRQVVTGLAELRRRNAQLLCTSMCVGSGMGGAGIFVNEAHS
ncbi:3-ketoacyl-CoA thiolase B, peroxisomal [Grifola frondosa]|uniref:3-ketoacyl-CoA thiolase B, peroxisomal n=1 Tax=Grifola frondosa TaxID=5627 RepID=A0A1C7MT33_GRIFR|nr:3-ketoacyl-CoA thiolase B, peroxisomal [Grifola frondosa]